MTSTIVIKHLNNISLNHIILLIKRFGSQKDFNFMAYNLALKNDYHRGNFKISFYSLTSAF